jgi:hypothetical protein
MSMTPIFMGPAGAGFCAGVAVGAGPFAWASAATENSARNKTVAANLRVMMLVKLLGNPCGFKFFD